MTAEQTLKQAVSFAKQKKTKEAQQLLRNFLKNHPQEDRAWYLLALLSENKHERISLLKQALRVNPDNQMAQQKLDALTTLTISTPHAEQPQNPDPVEPEPVILENLAEQAHTETPQPALQRQEKPIKPTAKPNLKFGWISLTVILGIALAFGVFTIIQNETLAAAIQSVGASSFSNSEPTVTSILPTQTAAATFAAAITETIEPTQTVTPYPTATATEIPTATNTATPTVTAFPTHTPTPLLPDSAGIGNISGTNQIRALSCESSAAIDWARYFGVNILEMDFHNQLPVSDNPEIGFVGSVDGLWGLTPPRAYGVHAEPVAKLLRAYGLPALAVKNITIEELKREIFEGHPVIIWIIGQSWTNVSPIKYDAQDGSSVTVAPYEHVVLLVGYGPDYVTILDGTQLYYRSTSVFEKSFAVLDSMAIIYNE